MQRREWGIGAAVGIALFLLLSAWAFASPPKSSPDDDFHQTSIWCAWGDSDTCQRVSPTTVEVPFGLVAMNCRNFDFKSPDPGCTKEQADVLTVTDRLRPDTGYNSPIFYWTLRTFVGSDIEHSVLMMRLFNAALASLLLALAVAVAKPEVKRALILTWLVSAVPFAAFNIASTNPSGWAIMGVGIAWAFWDTWLTSSGESRLRQSLAALGLLLATVVAAGARSDAAFYLLVSILAVSVLRSSSIRTTPKRLLIFLPLLPIAVAGSLYRGPAFLNAWFGSADASTGVPDNIPRVAAAMVADMPAFLAAPWGYFPASGVPWDGLVTWGLGWEGFPLPSFTSLSLLAALAAIAFWGLSVVWKAKALAIAVLLLTTVGAPLFHVWRVEFVSGVQSRYFLPILLVFMGVTLVVPVRSRYELNGLQRAVLGVLVFGGAATAIASTLARYQAGLGELWDTAWATVWIAGNDFPEHLPPSSTSGLWGILGTAIFVSTLVIASAAAALNAFTHDVGANAET